MSDPQTVLTPSPDGDGEVGASAGTRRWRRLRSMRLRTHTGRADDALTSDAAPGGVSADALEGHAADADLDAAPETSSGELSRWRHSVLRWEVLGAALTGIGVLILLFLVYLYALTPLTHTRDQHRLLTTLANERYAHHLATGWRPPEGDPVGVLRIPELGLRQAVVYGTSSADLQQGPGLMARTALPGAPGNAVIAGRRVTYGGPFRSLSRLVPGDAITVVDGLGRSRFDVVSVQWVSPGSSSSVGIEARSWLTLVTSGSSLGSDGRLVVLARVVGLPGTTVKARSVPPGDPSAALSFGGDPLGALLALLWTLGLFGVLGLMVVARRWWRDPWVAYVLAVPVMLACGLFACESLARCFPATL